MNVVPESRVKFIDEYDSQESSEEGRSSCSETLVPDSHSIFNSHFYKPVVADIVKDRNLSNQSLN